MREGILGRLGLFGAAAVGAIVGHCSAYVVAMWGRGGRDALLAATGQGYWHLTLGTAIILGIWLAGAVFLHHLRPGPRSPLTLGIWSLTLRLAALQVLLFASVEVGELLIGAVSIDASLLREVLSLGLAAQIVVALGIAIVLRLLVRAAEVLAEFLGSRYQAAEGPLFLRPLQEPLRPVTLLTGGAGVRGPPFLR